MSSQSLLQRVIDDGQEIFSDEYSLITCHLCESLLSPHGNPKSCPCGKQVLCSSCQKIGYFSCEVCGQFTFESIDSINKL